MLGGDYLEKPESPQYLSQFSWNIELSFHTPSIKMQQNSIHWPCGVEKVFKLLMDSDLSGKFT